MNLINKENTRLRNKWPVTITVVNNGLYFSAPACRLLELAENEYIHFLNENKEWSLYKDSNPDGFRLNKTKGIAGLYAFNRGLVIMFRKSVGSKDISTSYTLIETNIQHEGRPVYKIETNKPIFLRNYGNKNKKDKSELITANN